MKELILKFETEIFHIRQTCWNRESSHVLSLFSLVFAKKVDSVWWHWKYRENPFTSFSFSCFRASTGEPIVHAGALRVPVYCEGKTFLALQVVDCMTHPKWRTLFVKKRGLFVCTMDILFENLVSLYTPYVFGFSGKRHFLLGRKLLEYRKLERVIEVKTKTSRGPSKLWDIEELKPEEFLYKTELFFTLYLRDLKYKQFCVYKHPDYLKWRYIRAPLSYRFFIFKKFPFKKIICVIKEEEREVLLIDIAGISYINTAAGILAEEFKKPVRWWIPQSFGEVLKLEEYRILDYVYPCEKVFWNKLSLKEPTATFFYTMGDSDLF